MALRIRRGTDAERQTIVPLQGEPIYVTDTNKLYVGDGATQGGLLVGPQDQSNFDVVNDTTPQLGGNLDLNGNDITGIGNIDIDGYITATGAVNIGDNSGGDTLNVGALITSSLRPSTANAYDLGTPSRPWATAYIRDIVAEETIEANNITLKENLVSENSTVIYNGATDSLYVTTITAQVMDGDIIGSVFSDDSSGKLVDAQRKSFSTTDMEILGQSISVSNGSAELAVEATSINIESYSIAGDIFTAANFVASGSRGTKISPQNVQNGDVIGGYVALGHQDGNEVPKAGIGMYIDAQTGTEALPGGIVFLLQDYNGNTAQVGSINSRGVSEYGIRKHTPFADTAARDAAIPTPEAGMTVFVTDGDGAGNPQFQGYTGSAWVALN